MQEPEDGRRQRAGDVAGRYLALERPARAPPRGAFGIVWPPLKLLIRIAGWRAWRAVSSTRRRAVSAALSGLRSWWSTRRR